MLPHPTSAIQGGIEPFPALGRPIQQKLGNHLSSAPFGETNTPRVVQGSVLCSGKHSTTIYGQCNENCCAEVLIHTLVGTKLCTRHSGCHTFCAF